MQLNPASTRMSLAVALAGVFAAALGSPAAGQAPPATDIYLAPLAIRGSQVTVGTPVNITKRPGYDNQPSFTPDGKSILFTSIHDDAQADIYRYDLATRAITRVTSTPESEYSATVMPGGKRFSVIRVERDSTQRLWSFALDGTDPELVIASLKPVGYHAWLDDGTVATFVLGSRQSPNALAIANVRTGHVDTVARDIGRSLSALRGGELAYVQNGTNGSTLRALNWTTRASRDLMTLPGRTQDVAWLTADLAIAGDGSHLLVRHVGDGNWIDVADLANAGLTGITRLAVSPDGKWLAIVAVPTA